jgi:hypothetical protein
MVKILSAVLSDGLTAVEAACAAALADGVHSADIVLNILSRRREPGPVPTILTPEGLQLRLCSNPDQREPGPQSGRRSISGRAAQRRPGRRNR